VSPVAVLVGLLVLAYFGSMLVGGRAIRGFGLPSGTEFLLLGILIGPKFMGAITPAGLESFEPLVVFGLSSLALITGVHFGWSGERRVPRRRVLAGVGIGLVALTLTTAAASAAAYALTPYRGTELYVIGLGAGLVCTETTRHAVRWVTERYSSRGPLSELIGDVAEGDDVVPLLGAAALFVLMPQASAVALPLPMWTLVAGTLAAGGVMGATCAALFDIEPRTSQRWGIVLGSLLIAAGTSMRLGLSAMTAAFVMGLTTAALAKNRDLLHRMVAPTERAVMLPTFVLAGVYVTLPEGAAFAPIAIAAIAARLGAKLISGRLVAAALTPRPRAVVSLGLGLMPAGILTMSVGLACALRFPGEIGQTILALAAISAVAGEVIGPATLRRALRIAGEVADTPTPTPDVAKRPRGRLASRPVHRSRGSRGSMGGPDGASDAHGSGGS
jgi:Kef-type K+ transport system membrane component KefB